MSIHAEIWQQWFAREFEEREKAMKWWQRLVRVHELRESCGIKPDKKDTIKVNKK